MEESRADQLMRTSEVYRRMRSDARPAAASVDLARAPLPVDTTRAQAPGPAPFALAPGPRFLRRMLTRRPDLRETVLLVLVCAALLLGYR